jgi:hypothetical protein
MKDETVKNVAHMEPKGIHKWEDNTKVYLALNCQHIMQILKAHLCIWRPLLSLEFLTSYTKNIQFLI